MLLSLLNVLSEQLPSSGLVTVPGDIDKCRGLLTLVILVSLFFLNHCGYGNWPNSKIL